MELEIRSGEDYETIVRSGYSCTPETTFAAGAFHTCDIHGLEAGKEYFVLLKGVKDDGADTETQWSHYLKIYQGVYF